MGLRFERGGDGVCGSYLSLLLSLFSFYIYLLIYIYRERCTEEFRHQYILPSPHNFGGKR